MTPRINVACMTKNELGRFFPSALRVWSTFASDIIVLDDGSTDGTPEAAKNFGAFVVEREDASRAAWGAESGARAALFEAAWNFTRNDDYILWLDADMTPARSPEVLAETGADGVFFTLYDLWSERTYREDDFWRGHHVPRLWMIRKDSARVPEDGWRWSGRGIHAGHLPMNFSCERFAYAPRDFALLHYAYVTPELRAEKRARYASVASDLTDFERAHAASITDLEPRTFHLPFVPELRLTHESLVPVESHAD